jgi:RNA polymerase-binding transcription factor DksA
MSPPKTRSIRGGQVAARNRRERKLPSKPRRGTEVEIPRRWVWHYETLSSLRERLISERKQRLSEAAQPIEAQHGMNLADSASDEFDHELTLSRLSVDQDALYEVEAAMMRILDGKYGICEQTGKPIPVGRLKVLPWTRYRREVADRLERSGMIAPTQLGQLHTRATRPRTP